MKNYSFMEKESFMNFKVRKMCDTRYFLEYKDKNKNDEKLTVEVSFINFDNLEGNSLPALWKRYGYTKELVTNYIAISTYVTDKEGNCWAWYNPCHKLADDKKRMLINFDYMYAISEDNLKKLLKEIEKRFLGGVYNKFMDSPTCAGLINEEINEFLESEKD